MCTSVKCNMTAVAWQNECTNNYSPIYYRKWRKLRQLDSHLTFFTRHSVWPLGIILFPLTLQDNHTYATNTQMIYFTLIQSPSAYNKIFWRIPMKKLEEIASMIHNLVNFRISIGYWKIYSEPLIILWLTFTEEKENPGTKEQ